MNPKKIISRVEARASRRNTVASIAFVLACASTASAQQPTPTVASPAPLLIAFNSLPDSPGTVIANTSETISEADRTSSSLSSFPEPGVFNQTPAPALNTASIHEKYIDPGQAAPRLTIGNKVALGAIDAVSPYHAIGWAITAGYQQAVDGSPNYGTNAKAFAQRFGAAAARSSSQSIFSDSILASVLHQDPRYYRLGPGNSFIKRIAYAATRPFITRTDSGRSTVNLSLLGGNLGGAYLTKTYYPPLNQSNEEVLKTFGGSIGGSALGFAAAEFFGDGFNIFRHKP